MLNTTGNRTLFSFNREIEIRIAYVCEDPYAEVIIMK